MKWEQQIMKAPVQYSGTCKKCKQYVSTGDECPLKLPPKGTGLQMHGCPMRIERKPKSAFLARD